MAGAARRSGLRRSAASNWIALAGLSCIRVPRIVGLLGLLSSTRGRGWRPSGRFSLAGLAGCPTTGRDAGQRAPRRRGRVRAGGARSDGTGARRRGQSGFRPRSKLPQRASARTGPSDAPRRSVASAGRHPGDGRPRPSRESRTAPEASTSVPGSRARVHVVLRGSTWRQLGSRGGIAGGGDRLRNRIERAIGRGPTESGVRWFSGSSSARTKDCLEDVKQDFRASGLAHLLAVSGQNVAYIAIGIFGLGWLLRIPRVFRELMTLGAIAAYVLAVGWQPSVIRAGVAGALASLAWLAARPRDRWHFLAVGALVLLGWTPTSLLEPGFQLSFAAVAGIFVGVPRLNARLDGYPVPRGARDVLGVALVCGLVTAPIVLLHFGAAPVYTVPANALAFPAMPAVLGLGLLAAAADPFFPLPPRLSPGWRGGRQRGSSSSRVSSLRCRARRLTHTRRSWRCSSVPRPGSPPGTADVGSAAPAVHSPSPRLALRSWSGPRGRCAYPGLAGTGGAPGDVPGRGARRLGSPRDTERPAPRRSGTTRSERRRPAPPDGNPFAVGARAHASPTRPHRWGRRRHSPAGSGAVLDPGLAATGPDYEAMVASRARRVPFRTIRSGSEFKAGGLVLRVLWPPDPGPRGGSEPQRHRPRGYVRRARRVPPGRRGIRGDLALRLGAFEVVKVAHHGSADPGLDDQLRVLRPNVAVISAGRSNDYGHPRAETLAALAGVPGLSVYRTDTDGRVVVESDGRGVRVETAR